MEYLVTQDKPYRLLIKSQWHVLILRTLHLEISPEKDPDDIKRI